MAVYEVALNCNSYKMCMLTSLHSPFVSLLSSLLSDAGRPSGTQAGWRRRQGQVSLSLSWTSLAWLP